MLPRRLLLAPLKLGGSLLKQIVLFVEQGVLAVEHALAIVEPPLRPLNLYSPSRKLVLQALPGLEYLLFRFQLGGAPHVFRFRVRTLEDMCRLGLRAATKLLGTTELEPPHEEESGGPPSAETSHQRNEGYDPVHWRSLSLKRPGPGRATFKETAARRAALPLKKREE